MGLVVGLICGLDLCRKQWLGLICVICFLFVYIVRSRIEKVVEERKLEKKEEGKKNLTERREKK